MTQNTNFDVASFMNESIDATLDTKLDPIPEGEHMAQIGTDDKDVDLASGVSAKNGRAWLRLDMRVTFTDPNLAAQLKREKVTGRYSIMLDLNEQGKLDLRPQRNINLGKLRDAVGQNRPGPWNFNMLKGQPIKVKVKQKPNEDDPMNPYSEIVGVTRAV
jgi:hypothetical protein